MNSLSRRLISGLALILLAALSACSSIPEGQRADKRADVDRHAQQILSRFLRENPELEDTVKSAPGLFVGQSFSGMAGVVGGSDGLGVLIHRDTGQRLYLNVESVGVGAGVAAAQFDFLAIARHPRAVQHLEKARWYVQGEWVATAGDAGSPAGYSNDDWIVHIIPVSGASAGTTLALKRLSINHDLSDTGVSDVSYPRQRREGDAEEPSPTWTRALPFGAQKVVSLGYDLPLPYGAGVTAVTVDQSMNLQNLWIGFNGSEKQPFDWVSFDRARSDTHSVQLKADAWLFPFMNVFGIVGKVDGHATMDIYLDGNGMLDQMGVDCSGLIPPVACLLFQDETILLPINTSVNVTTYSVGTLLAGGWGDWFVTLPMTWTWAHPANVVADGHSMTVTPRGGRLFHLPGRGSIALFAGGNYLRTEQTITGVFRGFEPIVDIDFQLDQANRDNWNAVLGLNWEINRRMSLNMEYNGFIGSRDAWIAGFNYRF